MPEKRADRKAGDGHGAEPWQIGAMQGARGFGLHEPTCRAPWGSASTSPACRPPWDLILASPPAGHPWVRPQPAQPAGRPAGTVAATRRDGRKRCRSGLPLGRGGFRRPIVTGEALPFTPADKRGGRVAAQVFMMGRVVSTSGRPERVGAAGRRTRLPGCCDGF